MAFVVGLFLAWMAYRAYGRFFDTSEIDANQYGRLSRAAEGSCEAEAYLRSVVERGPIARKSMAPVLREIEARNSHNETEDARAKIMGRTPACATRS